MLSREEVNRLDTAIQRGVTTNVTEDFAYISVGGNLVLVKAEGGVEIYRLEKA